MHGPRWLRAEARAAAHGSGQMPPGRCLQDEPRADCIAIACSALEPECHRVVACRQIVPQQSNLGGIPVVEQDVGVSVSVKVEGDEGAAVFGEIQAGDRGQVRERSVPAIPIQNVPFVPAKAAVESDQPVQQGPAALVLRRAGFVLGGGRHDLPPKETSKIWVVLLRPGDEAVDDVDVEIPVVVEVHKVGAPRPTPHFHPRRDGDVFESRPLAAK